MNSERNLTIGIEIETIGQTRFTVAKAIQTVVGGTIRHVGTPSCYDPYEVTAADGRIWRVMADSSLSAGRDLQAEVVSPILRYDDIETVQQVVRAVRACGAKVDASCGLHIHIGSKELGVDGLVNLTKMIHKQQDLIHTALGIQQHRLSRWCRPVGTSLIERIERNRPRTLEDLNIAWYGYRNTAPQHYDETRYHGLNLHNVYFRNTVEFRWFEATLHAGKVKAYMQLAYAICLKAREARSASSKKRPFNKETAKYDFRVFLLKLGLIGDEFKTARLHLLSNLEGSAAWKNGRPERAAA
jgi:hypothetical protein